MKIKNLFFAITVVLLNSATAQYPCFNGISTNPLNPVNNQLTSKKNTFFNWQDSLWAMQPSPFCFRTNLNESPFYKIDNLEELREAKDMKWEDGWELLRRHAGLTETNTYTASNPEHLYVILYNKYTGILRVILMACRGADYNAAKIELKFDATTVMRTNLLEMSKGQIGALDRPFSISDFASGVKYLNENSKYFYADFPMMYDPCTCNYKSKLNILSRLITSGTINIEGGITGDVHTKNVGGKAEVQKPGTYSWKDFTSTINGKVTSVYGSIDKFRSATQDLAANIGRIDTANKREAIDKFANFLKSNAFLQSGLNAVPWLKSAIGVIDIFSSGGKSSSGPQEVKLLPLTVNLTAKLSGSISFINAYHNIIFTNPGSKDAQLDPDNYPYYNEVLGVFNLLETPALYVQSNYRLVPDPETGNMIRITENRYRFDLNTLRYVLNPAAGVSIQNMKAAIIIEGQNRNFPVCANSDRMIPPDFVYEGKEGVTNTDKFRTDYYDMICLGSRMFQANSYYNAVAAATATNPLPDVGCPNAYINNGFIKFMINLKRNNATATTQNILYVATFPLKVITDNELPNFLSNYACNDSSIVAPATVTEVASLCNNTSLYYTPSRYNRTSIGLFASEQHEVQRFLSIAPSPSKGNIMVRIQKNNASLKNIFITNLNGQKVFEMNAGNVNLSVGYMQQLNFHLPNGLYLIHALTDQGVLRTKMMIAR